MSDGLVIGAHGFALPIDAATARHVMLAKSGFGKTNASAVMTEEIVRAGVHTIVFDPLGKMHGLRSSADGESGGLQLAILGGRHGDVPLRADRGAYVCDQLLEGPGVSAVIDTSQMEDDDESTFVIDFLSRIAIRVDHVVMLVFEEAERFVPERSQARKGSHAKLAGVANRFVRECRNFGVGYVASSQRPQVLGKTVIESAEFIYAMRMNGSSAQGNVGAELETRVDRTLAREIIRDVQALERGGVWMIPDDEERWGEPQRFRFRLRDTFEIRPPKIGEGVAQAAPRVFAAIDLDRLREAMAEDVPESEHLNTAEGEVRIERVEVPVLTPEMIATLEYARAELSCVRIALEAVSTAIAGVEQTIYGTAPGEPAQGALRDERMGTGALTPRRDGGARRGSRPRTPTSALPRSLSTAGSIGGGPQKILEALAGAPNAQATRTQLGFLSGYAAGGGSFARYLSTLRGEGLIAGDGATIVLTDAGRARVTNVSAISTADVVALWRGKLKAGALKMFDALLGVWPRGFTRAELGDATGYEVEGGSFARYLSTLSGLDIVERRGRTIVLNDALFPTGAPRR